MDDAPKLRLLSATDVSVIGGRILPPDAVDPDAEFLEDADLEVVPTTIAIHRRRVSSPPPPPPPQAA